MSFKFFSHLYTDGFLTQWGFHRVQEHPKQSSVLRSILILIFLQFTCSLFIFVLLFTNTYFTIQLYVFTITYLYFYNLRVHYSFSYLLFTNTYFTIHLYVFTIHFTMHYALCTIRYALFTMHYALCTIYTYSLFYTYSYVLTIHVTKSRDFDTHA